MTGVLQLTGHHAGTVEIRGLASLDTGGSERPVVLMLPGYTGSKEDFAPLLDPLADNGFRAIAVDLPGQFESPGPVGEQDYQPDPLGRVIAGLITALPPPVVLFGHSFGGLVARSAVLAGARPAGLVLLSSGPGRLPVGPRRQALVLGEPVLRKQGVQAAYALLAGLSQQRAAARGAIGADPAAVSPVASPSPAAPTGPVDLAAFYRRRFLASSAAGLLGMGTALQTEPDRVAELADALMTTGIAVAVISGEADDAWGLDLQAEMARRLGSTLVVIPGAAHSAAVEQPDRLLRAVLPLLRSWTAR